MTLACNTLSVSNQSDYKVLVSVVLPGASGADSHIYQPGEVYDYYPGSGGRYTISVIPQEDYVAEMDELKANIILALTTKYDVMQPNVFVELTEKLAKIEKTLSSLTTHSCSGNLMDESNVMATINMTKDGEISLYCPSVGQ
jgi:hypothetical protein